MYMGNQNLRGAGEKIAMTEEQIQRPIVTGKQIGRAHV